LSGVTRLGLLVGAMMVMAWGAPAAPAPHVRIASLAQLPTPLPNPYDPAADAKAEVAAARAKARADGKLLLIDLGGAWCGDCRVLAGLMDQPEIAAFVRAHYVVVNVDVGRENRNLDIPAHYGVKSMDGVPSLLIVDSQGRLVNSGHVAALAEARSMTPQALADWLARWTD